jgi:outer membrane protein TolC
MLFALAATRAGAVDPQNLPNPLTLSEAVSIALANNTIIRTWQSQLDQASARYEQSRGVLLPQVGIIANHAYLTMNLRDLGIEVLNVSEEKQGPFGSLNARVILTQELLNIANLQAWKSSCARQDSAHRQVKTRERSWC